MHLIIVEDLPFDQEKLADLIRQDCDRRGEHVDLSFYASGEDFLAHYRPKSCDGLLMDILLGRVNGIEAARKVRESEPLLPIIFTTSEQDYAVESFDVRPADYLVKPLTPEKIARCMERPREYLSRPSSISLLEISGRGHSAPVDVPLDGILYAQCFDHIIQVNTVSGVYRTRCSFQDFTAQLPHTGRFCVCGRGLVINLSQVAQVNDDILVLKNGDTLAVPIRRKKEIRQAYTEWKFIRTRKGGLGVSVFW
ncbi:LytTR family DNA-binding domain-containing protein [Oscillospiraceae bacterium 38-13]